MFNSMCIVSFCRIITFTNVKSVLLKGEKNFTVVFPSCLHFLLIFSLLFSQYHRLNSVHPKSIRGPGTSIKVLTPNTLHATVFGGGVFKKVMKEK